MTLQGYDVVGLFPAMKSKTTGEIIRKFIINSEVQVKGFSWQQGARYIAINKHLTGELEAVNKFLPWKKSKKKVTMKNKGINKRKENLAWQFRDTKPNEGEIRQILARVAEIGAEHYGSTSATGLLTRSTTSTSTDRGQGHNGSIYHCPDLLGGGDQQGHEAYHPRDHKLHLLLCYLGVGDWGCQTFS